jgi:cyclopropane fatty-acyl-phospholipid synthase-like methyltransferase
VTAPPDELAWWRGLTGDDIAVNTEGCPPYDADRAARFIDAHLGVVAGRRVLDLGCGRGRLTARYQRLSRARVVGFDPAPRVLAEAQARVPDVAFAESIPDGPFDGAYSVTVFQHLPAEVCAGYVAEVMSKLTPSGRFVFQWVEGDEDAFLSHQTNEAEVRSWCAGVDMHIERDPVMEQWRWAVAG